MPDKAMTIRRPLSWLFATMVVGLLLVLFGISADSNFISAIGVCLWAMVSVGFGMAAGARKGGPAWWIEYQHLLVFVPPAVVVAWAGATKAGAPMVALMVFVQAIVPTCFGFWVGLAAAAASRTESLSAAFWSVVNILEAIFIAALVLGEPAARVLRFNLGFALGVYFPMGAALCSVFVWSRFLGTAPAKKQFVSLALCGLGWIYIVILAFASIAHP
jgi:hypothetical protein